MVELSIAELIALVLGAVGGTAGVIQAWAAVCSRYKRHQ